MLRLRHCYSDVTRSATGASAAAASTTTATGTTTTTAATTTTTTTTTNTPAGKLPLLLLLLQLYSGIERCSVPVRCPCGFQDVDVRLLWQSNSLHEALSGVVISLQSLVQNSTLEQQHVAARKHDGTVSVFGCAGFMGSGSTVELDPYDLAKGTLHSGLRV